VLARSFHVRKNNERVLNARSVRNEQNVPNVRSNYGCSHGRENVLDVGNCCYVAVCSAAEGASAPTGGGEGRGIPWRPPTYSVLLFLKKTVDIMQLGSNVNETWHS